MICDRLEGKVKQSVELGLAAELRNRSDGELLFYLDNHRWPDAEELEKLKKQEEEQARGKLPDEPKQLM